MTKLLQSRSIASSNIVASKDAKSTDCLKIPDTLADIYADSFADIIADMDADTRGKLASEFNELFTDGGLERILSKNLRGRSLRNFECFRQFLETRGALDDDNDRLNFFCEMCAAHSMHEILIRAMGKEILEDWINKTNIASESRWTRLACALWMHNDQLPHLLTCARTNLYTKEWLSRKIRPVVGDQAAVKIVLLKGRIYKHAYDHLLMIYAWSRKSDKVAVRNIFNFVKCKDCIRAMAYSMFIDCVDSIGKEKHSKQRKGRRDRAEKKRWRNAN